jgi:hypothetical protein
MARAALASLHFKQSVPRNEFGAKIWKNPLSSAGAFIRAVGQLSKRPRRSWL